VRFPAPLITTPDLETIDSIKKCRFTRKLARLAAAALLAIAFPAVTHAENFLGNLPQGANTGTLTIGEFTFMETKQLQYAVKFTAPSVAYRLESVQLTLQFASTDGPPRVSIHAADAGDQPGTEIAVLTNPPLTDTVDIFTFSSADVVKLEADTEYWFLVDHADNSSNFIWQRSSPPLLPSGEATFNLFQRSEDDGANYVTDLQYGSFQINASPIVYQPDLSIGESNRPGKARKNNKYNTTGAGQKLVVKLEGRRKERAFLFVQNDANDIDSISLRSNRPRKKRYRYRIFRLTGGRQNITAAVKSSAGFAFPDLAPGERITCRIVLKGKNKRGNHTIRYIGSSAKDGTKLDVNRLKVRTRN